MANRQNNIDWLKSVEIFEHTPDSVLESIAPLLIEVNISADENLIQEGDAGDCMYIVVEGELHAFAIGKHVGTFVEGDVVGEMAILDSEPRSASVRAITDARLYQLASSVLDQALAEEPEIAKGIIRMLVHRLRIREARLQSEIQQLRIEIDQIKQHQQVTEITESDFFADLQSKAKAMRERRRRGGQ